MRKGFSIIELVFVFVIIGILSAVVIPKFFNLSIEAKEKTLKATIGTLNRISTGDIYGKLAVKNDHSIKNLDDNDKLITNYIEVGKIFYTNKDNPLGLERGDLKLSGDTADNEDNVNDLPQCNEAKGWILLYGKDDNGNAKPVQIKAGDKIYEVEICDNTIDEPLKFVVIKSDDGGQSWKALK